MEELGNLLARMDISQELHHSNREEGDVSPVVLSVHTMASGVRLNLQKLLENLQAGACTFISFSNN